MANKETTAKTKKTAKPAAAKKSKTTATVKEKTVQKEKVVTLPKETEQKQSSPTVAQAPAKTVRVKRIHVIWFVVLVCVAALLYIGRSLFIAAVVNGQPISRLSVVQEVEKQNGKTALDGLVRNSLIEQEARKQNVTVSEKEIDDEISKLETTLSKQGQKLDQALQMQGMDRQKLREYIRLDKLVTKMVGKDVTVSDEEVNKYIEENKAMLSEGQKPEDQKKAVVERLKQQKLSEKVNIWLQDLQKKANIIYFVNY